MSSTSIIFLNINIIEYYIPSLSCCRRYTSRSLSKTLVSILIGLSNMKSIRQSTVVKAFLSLLNIFWQSVVQINSTFFFVNSINGSIMSKYPLINRQLKFPNPRNPWSFFRFLSSDQSSTFQIFSGSILIPSISIINPKKSTSFLWNLYFFDLYLSCLVRSYPSISLTCFRWSFRFSE